MNNRNLVVLGCSQTKVNAKGLLPAVSLYDGPAFRVLRAFLRDYKWPKRLSVAVLSAKHGLVGALSHLAAYDERMTPERAVELNRGVTAALCRLAPSHRWLEFVMGKDYLPSINLEALSNTHIRFRFVDGPIGIKLNRLHDLLRSLGQKPQDWPTPFRITGRPLYFLPDWDDFLDAEYNFTEDQFSTADRSQRHEEHSINLMRPHRLCDGVLVSLAQNLGSKGLLKRMESSDQESLAPRSVREHFLLRADQWAFGDCGAFSYVAEETPAISVEQAVSLYNLYDFDLGASVDHIAVPEIPTAKGRRRLSEYERRLRVKLTRGNAERFLEIHRERGARFIPVGVVQGLGPRSYANQIGEYVEMGYEHLAIGGLVPRSDHEVLAIVREIHRDIQGLKSKPWVHLMGIFRPSLQPALRELGIASFDSATYFRKAWLRSDQNYLGVEGQWYAAIRVPPLSDPRTKRRLEASGVPESRLRKLEERALRVLRAFDRQEVSVDETLEAVIEYDRLLQRAELVEAKLVSAYRRTLEVRPWRKCPCPMCESLGIEILIFRGLNRNKRRGAHNTLQLFQKLKRQTAQVRDAELR